MFLIDEDIYVLDKIHFYQSHTWVLFPQPVGPLNTTT